MSMLISAWTYNQVGPFQPLKYTPDTWEYIAYSDIFNRRVYAFSYTAFRANRDLKDVSMLELAKDAADAVWGTSLQR